MRYAEVIVDLSAEAVDRRFTYAVPEGMALSPGMLVTVPFGPRTLDGFVIRLTDQCNLDPEKIKPVLRAARQEPVILPDLMALADWMHRRYLCNLVDALRLMIPAEMRGGRVREKTLRYAHLKLSPEAVAGFIEQHPRAKKQIEIVRRLTEGDIETPRLDSGALKALVDKGAVEIVAHEARRTPLALADDERAPDPALMPGQAMAVEKLTAALSTGGRFLLHGVTGSGKTEVYIRLIREALRQGKTAVVLVPEIALTPQMVRWLHARFGADAAVLHSALSAGERFDEWRRIRSGAARVVIGARSAIFAPLQNIGCIIVDEEHESSYQSDRRPRYDARQIAWRRAADHSAVLALGSPTPSIDTYMRVMPGVRPENKLELIELKQRVMNRPLPEVELVDMRGEFERGNSSVFSGRLARALRECLDGGRQAMLFINRRGHSSFVSCRRCGYVVKCDQCDVSMTYHRAGEALRCHYCGRTMPPPRTCPSCGSVYIKYFGAGTQKVQEEVARLFPDARVGRMDIDTTQGKDAHQKILDAFRRGDTNVLVGTQMIAKGLDFPNVTLVGVVAADMTLNLPDYRSVERTFQLITQVAGRAGRADAPGRVVVQTYDPEHYGIACAAAQDYRAFYTREAASRRLALYPPYTVIARVVFSSKEARKAENAAREAESALHRYLVETGQEADALQCRACEAPIAFLRSEHRWQLFVKLYFKADVEAVTRKMQAIAEAAPEGVRGELEVNPVNMI